MRTLAMETFFYSMGRRSDIYTRSLVSYSLAGNRPFYLFIYFWLRLRLALFSLNWASDSRFIFLTVSIELATLGNNITYKVTSTFEAHHENHGREEL